MYYQPFENSSCTEMKEIKNPASFIHYLNSSQANPFLEVEHLCRPDLFSLCLQAQGREKPSLYELGLGYRGKGMHAEITQS